MIHSSCQRRLTSRLDTKLISGEGIAQRAPARSSLIHVGLQGSFCPNGVSGTIPLVQGDIENRPNGAIEPDGFFPLVFLTEADV